MTQRFAASPVAVDLWSSFSPHLEPSVVEDWRDYKNKKNKFEFRQH